VSKEEVPGYLFERRAKGEAIVESEGLCIN